MESLNTIFGLTGVFIAAWALNLQRKEIRRNSRIAALTQTISLIQARIDFHYKIIDDFNAKGKTWKGHADKINTELRPLQAAAMEELLSLYASVDTRLSADVVRAALLPVK